MDYLFLALGLGLLLLAADLLVDSSVAIAQRARISNFIIGLTIVGMGTSSPELFVSVSSALGGSGDVAMGNVVGSNILARTHHFHCGGMQEQSSAGFRQCPGQQRVQYLVCAWAVRNHQAHYRG